MNFSSIVTTAKMDLDIPEPIKEDEVTPEKIYKSFQEWEKLGKQDPTEPSPPKESDVDQNKNK